MPKVNLIDAIVNAPLTPKNKEAVLKGLSNNGNTLTLRGSQLSESIVLSPDEDEQVVLGKQQRLRILIENSQNLSIDNSILVIEFNSGPLLEFINKGTIEILAVNNSYSKNDIYGGIDLLEFTGVNSFDIVNQGSIVCKFTQAAEINIDSSDPIIFFFYNLFDPGPSGNTGNITFTNNGSLQIEANNLTFNSNCEILFFSIVETFTVAETTGFLNTGDISIKVNTKTAKDKIVYIAALRIFDFASGSPVNFVNQGTIDIDMDHINGRIRGLQLDSSTAAKGTFQNYGTIISRQKYQSKLEESNNNSISLDFVNTGFINEKGGRLILLNFSDSTSSNNIRLILTTVPLENFQNKGTIYTGVDYRLNRRCLSDPKRQWFLIKKMYPVIIQSSSSSSPSLFINTGSIYLYSPLSILGFQGLEIGNYNTIPLFRQKPALITDGIKQPGRNIGSRPYLELLKFQQNYNQYQLEKLCKCMFWAQLYFNKVDVYNLPNKRSDAPSNKLVNFYDGAFGGSIRDDRQYIFPIDAEPFAGFFQSQPTVLSFPRGGKLQFYAGFNVAPIDIYFRFEKNPFPDTEPSFNTNTITIEPNTYQLYTIDIDSQDPDNVYASQLLFLVERDIAVTISPVVVYIN